MHDLIIIGGGPAGLSAAIYATRKKIKTLLLAKALGGQIIESFKVENYLGIEEITGPELVKKFVDHAKKFELEFKEGEGVAGLKKIDNFFEIFSEKGKYEAKSIIIAMGLVPKKLRVPGASEFLNKGIHYCATCDAPLYGGKRVAVVGAGDAGLDAAWQLTNYADKIYVLNKYSELKSDDLVLQDKIKAHPKIEMIDSMELKEIKGGKFVESLVYEQGGQEKEIAVDGIFVEIGYAPSLDFLGELVKLNDRGEILINPDTNETSVAGIFAAGDVTNVSHKQLIVAAGEGAKAALSVYQYLKSRSV